MHLVFVTKYRRKVFEKTHLQALGNIFHRLCKQFQVVLVGFDGEKDYVHLLVNFLPKIVIAKLVNSLKGALGRLLKAK